MSKTVFVVLTGEILSSRMKYELGDVGSVPV
jgi:hypothetical protein